MIWRRRARRDVQVADRVDQWMRYAEASGPAVMEVVRVYQAAHRGTKAVIRIHGTERHRDAWFWWTRVSPGQLLVVDAHEDYGTHSGRPNVLFIGSEHGPPGGEIHVAIPSGDVMRWRHHQRRTWRSAASNPSD